jgi:hypothetical protein
MTSTGIEPSTLYHSASTTYTTAFPLKHQLENINITAPSVVTGRLLELQNN